MGIEDEIDRVAERMKAQSLASKRWFRFRQDAENRLWVDWFMAGEDGSAKPVCSQMVQQMDYRIGSRPEQ